MVIQLEQLIIYTKTSKQFQDIENFDRINKDRKENAAILKE